MRSFAIAVIVVVMWGCGSKPAPVAAPAEPATTESQPPPAEPAAEEDCTLCYMGCMEGAVMEMSDEEANAVCEADCGC
jgi:hypothetical protein